MRTRHHDFRSPGWFGAAAARVALCVGAAVLGTALAAGAAPPSARTLYERAVTLDRDVRAAMTGRRAPASGPEPFRRAIAAYERVVWHHPASGYCDNALWQASQLAVEVFDRFGHDRDRLAALTSLRRLVREYPTSGFVRRARAGIQRLEHLGPAPGRGTVPGGSGPRAVPEPVRPPPDAAPAQPVTLERVSRHAADGVTSVVLHVSGTISFREERLANPPRIFFDLAGTLPSDTVKDAILTFGSGVVRQIRVGRHPGAVTRVVLDAEGVGRYHAAFEANPHRLVVTCWPDVIPATAVLAADATLAAPTPSVSSAHAPTPAGLAGLPASAQPIDTRTGTAGPAAPVPVILPAGASATPAVPPAVEAPRPAGSPAPGERPATPPATPSSNAAGGFSLARQLGLGASRLVIDAGHGGHDPGAMFGNRTEASITLDIALRLEKLLLKQPGVDVVLTRRTDVFVPLQERTAIANRAEADLFVSIHVNASENTRARGVETYVLDFASDEDAERVAARENASSQMTISHLNDLVKRIALTTKADESRDLASHLQRSLVRRLRPQNPAMRDLGVKRAPFVVLIGASMPSVLVEVAFLTHRQERRLLATPTYRQQVAESIADGLRRYQQELKKASPVVLRRDSLPPARDTGGVAHLPGRGNRIQ